VRCPAVHDAVTHAPASAPEVVDYGPAEDRTDQFDGYTVNFTSIREDSDLAPLLKGLPGDSCQCPHGAT
jgi:hypothetical protein